MKHQLRKPEGRKYYNLTFTDPKTHERVKISTGCELKGAADKFAYEHFKTYQLGQGKAADQTIGSLMDIMLAHYRTHKPARYENMQTCWNNRMADKFSTIAAREFTFADIEAYKTWCAGGTPKNRRWAPIIEKLKDSTINRDLATLSRLFSFSLETEQIDFRGPKFIRHSEIAFRRKGYVSQEEFDRMVATNPPLWLRGMMEVAYNIANRRGELVNLRVRQLDFLADMVRLDGDDTKNKKARGGPMTPAMRALLLACIEGKGPEDHVFTREDRGLPRRRIGNFRCYWRDMLKAAGIERNVLFHDFRRSGVTNMIHRGVDRETAKQISGHLTDHVFNAYNIVTEKHVQNAGDLIAAGAERERRKADKSCVSEELETEPEVTEKSTDKSLRIKRLGVSPN